MLLYGSISLYSLPFVTLGSKIETEVTVMTYWLEWSLTTTSTKIKTSELNLWRFPYNSHLIAAHCQKWQTSPDMNRTLKNNKQHRISLLKKWTKSGFKKINHYKSFNVYRIALFLKQSILKVTNMTGHEE